MRGDAARSLAAVGTPAAFLELVGIDQRSPEGTLKRDLVDAASDLSNRESSVVLFEALSATDDPAVLKASQAALAGMADANIVWEAVARYRAATDPLERAMMTGVIRGSTIRTVPVIGQVADTGNGVYEDSMALAAVDTLAYIGVGRRGWISRGPPGGCLNAGGCLAGGGGDRPDRPPGGAPCVAEFALGEGESAAVGLPARIAATRALGNYPPTQVEDTLNRLLRNRPTPTCGLLPRHLEARSRPRVKPERRCLNERGEALQGSGRTVSPVGGADRCVAKQPTDAFAALIQRIMRRQHDETGSPQVAMRKGVT
jgi:hypothetical protein